MDDTIAITSTFSKSDLQCTVCFEPLTKKIYQCANGPHYVCEICKYKLPKKECPTCKHPGDMVRFIALEEQLKQHLTPCVNTGCCEKFFKWHDAHNCKFALVKCKICKRDVSGNLDLYASHLNDCCDQPFKVLKVAKFDKKLRYKIPTSNASSDINNIFSAIVLPDKHIIVIVPIKCNGCFKYGISVFRDPSIENPIYTNMICSYTHNGIDYTVAIPIVERNNVKTAEVTFSSTEDNIFIFSKDLIIPPVSKEPISHGFRTGSTTSNPRTPSDYSYLYQSSIPITPPNSNWTSVPSSTRTTSINPDRVNPDEINNIFSTFFNTRR
jgi:hypothetical protein